MKNIDLQSNCLVVDGDNRLPFNMFGIVFRNCATHEGYQQLIARFITWLRPSMQSEGMTLPNDKNLSMECG